MKYIVWFSWGIDSTFIWRWLKKHWHEVLFVNLKNTINPNKCCQVPKKLYEISEKLKIPLEIIDTVEIFKKMIIDNFIEYYTIWKTPNPCIRCNELIRFPILEYIRKKYNYDKISTWHYAKIINIEWKNFLAQADDKIKDQSYMLYRINLDNIDFINWIYTKNQIRDILKKENILFTEEESQNLCFINDNYQNFIINNINKAIYPWKIYDKYWNYLWEHRWIIYYTIWQRHNIFLKKTLKTENKKYFVIDIIYEKNIIIVWEEKDLYKKEIKIKNKIIKDLKRPIFWKIRYKHNPQEIININEDKIIFKDPIRAPTPWQHLVLYHPYDKEMIVLGWWEIIW